MARVAVLEDVEGTKTFFVMLTLSSAEYRGPDWCNDRRNAASSELENSLAEVKPFKNTVCLAW